LVDNGCRGINDGVSTPGGCAVRRAALARPIWLTSPGDPWLLPRLDPPRDRIASGLDAEKFLIWRASGKSRVPEDAQHRDVRARCAAWMATCATIKGPVSLGAQKISLVRIRSIDCECEGEVWDSKEAIGRHSHRLLPHGKSRPLFPRPTRPRQPSPRWGGRPGGRPRCALLQRIGIQRNWTRCLPAAYLNWRRTRESLLV
jgi:hypothetical protein